MIQTANSRLTAYKQDLVLLHKALAEFSDSSLLDEYSLLETLHFSCECQIATLSKSHGKSVATVSTDSTSTKLPKMSIPSFDGDLTKWQMFWQLFETSVHSQSSLSNAEKFVYLQNALKDSTAKSLVANLSPSGDQYSEAIKCLQDRYNRPRLVLQAHTTALIECPSLKEGSSRELRRIHDTWTSHTRALKVLGATLDHVYLTTLLQMKLDRSTTYEWEKHSKSYVMDVPPLEELLEFLDFQARALEGSAVGKKTVTSGHGPFNTKKLSPASRGTTHTASTADPGSNVCVLCATERHPLYVCTKFRGMTLEDRRSMLKSNHLCFNCLRGGHFTNQCNSSSRCKKCNRPHHTLLHVGDRKGEANDSNAPAGSNSGSNTSPPQGVSNTTTGLHHNVLLKTCRVIVYGTDGAAAEARALLDDGSTLSLISERLASGLQLKRSKQKVAISGVAGLTTDSQYKTIANLRISSTRANSKKMDLTAVVVPKVTCDLPINPIPFDTSWSHIDGLDLADPSFGEPGRVDLLLGIDVCMEVMCHGRRTGPKGSPSALQTEFGWVLGGKSSIPAASHHLVAHTMSQSTVHGDEILKKFWEIEEAPTNTLSMTPQEQYVVKHFHDNHSRTEEGRYVVPLPKKETTDQIGESRSQAVRRFLSMERTLRYKGRFHTVDHVIKEYMELGHAEVVPAQDLGKDVSQVFYMPIHVVYKDTSSTTKVRAVFDGSAKSSTGVSLNDLLLVGPTVHPQLMDVLLRFRVHRVALTTDVSKMYRAVCLAKEDRDYHRFIWRSDPSEKLTDFRMTRVTFGISASCFAANMAIHANAMEHAAQYPLASKAVTESFYVDDGLIGAEDIEQAVLLRTQLQELFNRGGFTLRKWSSSEAAVLSTIPSDLQEPSKILTISESTPTYTKTLGIKWDVSTDLFQIDVGQSPVSDYITKRGLCSDIARVYDVMGWISPATITMKVLLQRTWEIKLGWDDPVPTSIKKVWLQWRTELDLLASMDIPRCYFPKTIKAVSVELHGFSDASEEAYAGVVYLRVACEDSSVHTTLVVSKTKVAPIKRVSIPRLELCGAVIVARLLKRVCEVLHIPLSHVHAWTDSTVVLGWLTGNPRRFKTYVGNRVSEIMESVPPDKWSHVASQDNPADCASRGIRPSQLLQHHLWWHGPTWLVLDKSHWPKQAVFISEPSNEEKNVCNFTVTLLSQPVVPFSKFSSYTKLLRVTAWVLRFIHVCRGCIKRDQTHNKDVHLSSGEMSSAEQHLLKCVQAEAYGETISQLCRQKPLSKGNKLTQYLPFMGEDHLLKVGGRMRNSQLPYVSRHPVILPGDHTLTKMLIRSEHLRLLHAGATLVMSSLSRRFLIISGRRVVRSTIRQCVTCRRLAAQSETQLMGQLPAERVTPHHIFAEVGVDYAGPLLLKLGKVRKPTLVKAYVRMCVCLHGGESSPSRGRDRSYNRSIPGCFEKVHCTSWMSFSHIQ